MEKNPYSFDNVIIHYGTPRHSGRYPWGSGDRPRQHVSWFKKRKERKNVEKNNFEKYVDSPEFLKGDYKKYKEKNNKWLSVVNNKPLANKDTIDNGPNWRFADGDVKNKKSRLRLEAGTKKEDKNNNVIDVEYKNVKDEKKSSKKSYESPSIKREMDQETATKVIKADTEYRKAVKENEDIRNPKTSSTDLAKAANYMNKVSQGTDNLSRGVDKAWTSIHDAKYKNEDRSKNVRGLSNEELRRVVERIRLDQQYNELTMPPKSKGYDRAMAALAVLGSAATVTATGISIVASIKALKGR